MSELKNNETMPDEEEYVYDENENEYIDLGSGIAVNIFGVADDEWLEAVTEQASMLSHTSNL